VKLVTPPHNPTKVPLLNLESYKRCKNHDSDAYSASCLLLKLLHGEASCVRKSLHKKAPFPVSCWPFRAGIRQVSLN
jgi:hypothetical protein